MGTKENFFLGFFSHKAHFFEFIRYFVPEIDIDSIQLEDLKMESSLFVDAAFGKRNNDLLYTIRYGGRDIYVYILVEHQSSVNYSMAYRVLVYMSRIWERYAKSHELDEVENKDFLFPAIIPVVYYEGTQSLTASRNFKERVVGDGLFDQTTPSFQYHLLSIPSDEMSSEALDRKGVKGAIRFFLEAARLKYEKPEEGMEELTKAYNQLDEPTKAMMREMAYPFAMYLFGEGKMARTFLNMMKGGEEMAQAVVKTWLEHMEDDICLRVEQEKKRIEKELREKMTAETAPKMAAEMFAKFAEEMKEEFESEKARNPQSNITPEYVM